MCKYKRCTAPEILVLGVSAIIYMHVFQCDVSCEPYLGNEDELLHGNHSLLQVLKLQYPVSHPVAHLQAGHVTVT